MGAIGLEVADEGTLREVAEISHADGPGKGWDGDVQILRSLVVDDSLYTISHTGILQSSLDTLEERARLDF